MTTTGTYAFDPEVAEFATEAFERCGIDPASLTGRHVTSARRSLAFLFSEWGNKGPHLWAVDQQTQALTDGTASYVCASGTVAILEVVVRRSSVDTPVNPMGRDEYLAIPNKTSEGLPSRYWVERQANASVVYLWPTPENSTDQIVFYRMRALQDIGTATSTLDIPPRWHEALVSGLAAKLAVKFAPDRIGPLKGEANSRFLEAKQEDRERTPTNTRIKFNTGLRR